MSVRCFNHYIKHASKFDWKVERCILFNFHDRFLFENTFDMRGHVELFF